MGPNRSDVGVQPAPPDRHRPRRHVVLRGRGTQRPRRVVHQPRVRLHLTRAGQGRAREPRRRPHHAGRPRRLVRGARAASTASGRWIWTIPATAASTSARPWSSRARWPGKKFLRTARGKRARGTLNNCANGYTPWGTYLTCEENFNGYFGTDDESWEPSAAAQDRYGLNSVRLRLRVAPVRSTLRRRRSRVIAARPTGSVGSSRSTPRTRRRRP